MTGKDALTKLMAGNERYLNGSLEHPHQTSGRRGELAGGQQPFACILSCADSRVPPEVVFDCGLGDLFVLRVAGNIANDMNIGSLEYAVAHLGAQLIVVLGHTKCGAVAATVQGGEAPGKIGSLVQAIKPAVDAVKDQTGDIVYNAVCENVKRGVDQIQAAAPILSEKIKADQLKIAGAYYDLDTGKVVLLD
jgi:carbonic anhydrase